MTPPSPATPSHYPGRFLLAVGLALPFLGILAYVVQVSLQRLMTPWYMPVLATLGVVLVFMAIWQARSVWRVPAP
jgi:hypothetical protein